jgi:hypothetical protein
MLHAAIAAGMMFVGSTPCDVLPREFVGVPAGVACERITWELTLSEPASGAFHLTATYGMTAVNDPGFQGGGTTMELRGTWSPVQGASPVAGAAVYRLTAGNPARTMDVAAFGEDLLHPLDSRGAPLVGNAGWSYTLSRQPAGVRPARGPFAGWLEGSPSSEENGGAVASAAGVFEGRTACQDLARTLDLTVPPGCFKLKWRLTLVRDQGTRARGTYTLEGTGYRAAPRAGAWTIRTAPNDARVVIQLDPDSPGGFMSLLRAGDDVLLMLDRQGRFLVGDIHFSHTLNRVK